MLQKSPSFGKCKIILCRDPGFPSEAVREDYLLKRYFQRGKLLADSSGWLGVISLIICKLKFVWNCL
jgi:hypothetical protein